MEITEIIEEINVIFCETLKNSSIVLTESTDASHIEEWDSLNNIVLMSAVESHFNVKFKLRELLKLKNIGDLCSGVQRKLA